MLVKQYGILHDVVLLGTFFNRGPDSSQCLHVSQLLSQELKHWSCYRQSTIHVYALRKAFILF
jgi:hypothetical protein